jgi:hypothetical protein
MKPTEFLNELSNEKLAKYKTAASADATKADSEGDTEKANKRFSGIVKATKKQFANDEKQSVTEVANLSMDASQALQKLKQIAEMRSKFTYYGLQEAGHADIVLNAIKACSVFIDHFKNNKQLDYVQILKKLQTEIIAFKNADAFTTLGQLLQGTLGKINFQQGVAEAGNNYHANRTGFSRPSNHRDDERHDLDKPTQVWGLKINGKVWSKGGKDVTFTSKEAALNIRNSILKNRPDLEIGLVTKGGVAEGEGNFVGDTPVNLGGVTVKRLGIGDIVTYLGQRAKIVGMSRDKTISRITIEKGMGSVTQDVRTSNLKRTGMAEADNAGAGFGPGYPGTYEEENKPFTHKGGYRTTSLTYESVDYIDEK